MKLKEIEKKMNRLYAELEPLKKQKDKLTEARAQRENAKLVDKCFVYQNSYGGGDNWNMYFKVLKVKGSWIEYVSIQKTPHGKIEIKRNETITRSFFEREIPSLEFKKHFVDMTTDINKAL